MLDQAKLIKQAWDMKRQMDKIQKEAGKKEIVINRGFVTITITGMQQVRDVKLALTADDLGNLKKVEQTVKDAINQAISDSQEMMKKDLAAVTGGMNIPGLT